MSSIKARSYAKINLYLKILGRRSDGYHDLDTLMQTISLSDDLIFNETGKGINIACDDPLVPIDERNICFKAADLLIKKFNLKKGIDITLKKRIPSEAGLGGGSSNAAVTLVALNKLWKLKLSKKSLISLGSRLGADVPFFIIGGRCVCKGVGDKIAKVQSAKSKVKNKEYYILIKPDVSVSTKWAYRQWDKIQNPKSQIPNKFKIQKSKFQTGNDLESVAIKKYPVIQKTKDDLINAGCSFAQMTGSGSAVFGIANNKTLGNKILKSLEKKYKKIFLIEDVDRGVQIVK